MFFSFSSSAKGQTTQTTPLIEARQEKTKEFQTQLLHYFSKNDDESDYHHTTLHIPMMMKGSRMKASQPLRRGLATGNFARVYACTLMCACSRRTDFFAPMSEIGPLILMPVRVC